jgi:hypothetical protein
MGPPRAHRGRKCLPRKPRGAAARPPAPRRAATPGAYTRPASEALSGTDSDGRGPAGGGAATP